VTKRTGPAGSVSFLLARVGFESARRLKERLAPYGLDPRQFALLNLVAMREGSSQQAIGDAIGIPKSRMVAFVDALERRGAIERRPSDRRTHALHLTDEGRKLLQETRRLAREHDADLSRPLTASEREQLVELLTKLAAEHDVPAGVHPALVRREGAAG
jgi:DNA-binding MarR family transcriptional regulator